MCTPAPASPRSPQSAGGAPASQSEDDPPPLPEFLRAALEEIYSDCDREIAGLGIGCWVHGECCDLERRDHVLFASSVEVAYVLEKHTERMEPSGRKCPFWVRGKCTERERRPLGCRTYFCDPRFRDALEAIHERRLRRIRKLAEAHGFPPDYGPFVAWIRRLRSQDRASGSPP